MRGSRARRLGCQRDSVPAASAPRTAFGHTDQVEKDELRLVFGRVELREWDLRMVTRSGDVEPFEI